MDITKRITVRGTGLQAPYGIGEIITSYCNTPAGRLKALRKAHYWYNPAAVYTPDGQRITIEQDDIIRPVDRGYVQS